MAVALDAAGPPLHAVVLKDLFWTLYSKLAAVLEGHRVVFEVARWIASVREGAGIPLTSSDETSRTHLLPH
jgi:exocyst complex component 4